MTENKAIILLNTFTEEELKGFKKYLRKNYSSDNLAGKIFKYYFQNREAAVKDDSLLAIATVYKKVVKKRIETKGRKVFLNALHNLNKALKAFLLSKEMEKDSFEKDQLLIKIFQERKLAKFVKQTIQNRVQKINNQTIKSQWHSLQLMQLSHHAYFEDYEAYFNNKAELIQGTMVHLDDFYTTLKMYYSAEMANRSRLVQETYQVLFKTEIINHIDALKNGSESLSYLYYLGYELVKNKAEVNYQKLATYLATHRDQLSLSDQQFANAILLTFNIRAYRKGKLTYATRMLDIYKNNLAKGLFFYNGQLTSNTLLNIVTTACAVQQFKWAITVINQYQKYLPPSLKAPTVHLAKAIIYFQEGNFKLVLSTLNQVDLLNISFKLRAKAIILRTYYEIEENEDLIIDFCTSFTKFLTNNRHIQPNISSNYLVLIKYVKLLIKKPLKFNQAEIITQIKAEKALQFKKWLLEKATKLT